jgi:6-phosphogluconate dehydrogenase
MQLGMIGLGRMGASMVRRLLGKGVECVVHDAQPAGIASLRDGVPKVRHRWKNWSRR